MNIRSNFFSIILAIFTVTSLRAMEKSNAMALDTFDILDPACDQRSTDSMPAHILQACSNLKNFGLPQDVRRIIARSCFAVFILESCKQSEEYNKLLVTFQNENITEYFTWEVVQKLDDLHKKFGIEISAFLLRSCCKTVNRNLEDINRNSRTLLHESLDNLNVAKILLRSIDDVNAFAYIKDNKVYTALLLAAYYGNVKIAEVIFSMISCPHDLINVKDKNDMTVLDIAREGAQNFAFGDLWRANCLKFAEFIQEYLDNN